MRIRVSSRFQRCSKEKVVSMLFIDFLPEMFPLVLRIIYAWGFLLRNYISVQHPLLLRAYMKTQVPQPQYRHSTHTVDENAS